MRERETPDSRSPANIARWFEQAITSIKANGSLDEPSKTRAVAYLADLKDKQVLAAVNAQVEAGDSE